MSPLEEKLVRIGGQINRWRAFEGALFGVAALFAGWFALSFADLWLRPRDPGRLVLSGIFLMAIIAALVALVQILKHRRSPAAVAALLEHRFPQLDNHLINRVLFATDAQRHSDWLRAYLSEAVPNWADLPLAALKNRRRRQIGAGAMAAAMPPCA